MGLSKKELIIIAGANGSGKTTFAKKLLQGLDYSYLNADEIAVGVRDEYRIINNRLYKIFIRGIK